MGGMKPELKQLFAVVPLSALLSAHAIEPVVQLDFEPGLRNTGSCGGEGYFHTSAVGEEPYLGQGPFGHCLDLTAAVRHGGATPEDPPSGGSVRFAAPALDNLERFTLTLWARRNPLHPEGHAARLLHKSNAWDLLPHAAGVTLMLGPGSGKVPYTFRGADRHLPSDEWFFYAVAVTPQSLTAYRGGCGSILECLGTLERSESFTSATGAVEVGNFNGIRPFNGWIDRLRLYASALDASAVTHIFNTDSQSAAPPPTLHVTHLPPLAPPERRFTLPHSAIPFSTRWQKNTNAHAVMRSFHATHCLWVYGTEGAFIDTVRSSGIFYQGTLNGLQGREHSTTNRSARGDTSGRHEDLDGNKNMPHWMVTFGPRHFTGCCNSAAFRERFFADAGKLIDVGVDSIHVDDWEMNASWVFHGGVCFCEFCRTGFREWLKQRHSTAELLALGIGDIDRFDYRQHLKDAGVPDAESYRRKFRELPLTPLFTEYQIESMRLFYTDFRRALDQRSPDRYIPVAVNTLLTPRRLTRSLRALDVVDLLHGESSQSAAHQDARSYIAAAGMAAAVGIPQIVSPIPRSTARTRAAIATAYALGQFHLVPWDLYMGSDASGSQPRYFGTREQYGDLYDFIHAHRELLDGCTAVAETGVLVNCDDPGDYASLCHALAAHQLPFHIIPVAAQHSQLPLRRESLEGLRLLIETAPATTLAPADRDTLEAFRSERTTRIAAPSVTEIPALARLMTLDLLRLEGPENIYALLRVDHRRRIAAIHLVNWNFQPGAERAARYAHLTLTLQHPERWGALQSIHLHQPAKPSVAIEPERHPDCIRIALPALTTWGIVQINFGDTL